MSRMNVTDAAARKLQEMILSGELEADQQLPSQIELSRQLGISRASLRESLSTLETLGFLRIEPGRGTFVAQRQNPSQAHLASRSLDGRYTKPDIYQSRLYLESLVVFEVTRAITPVVIARLNEFTTLMCAAWDRGDLVGVVNHDRDFHHAIWEVCPNALLRDLCYGLADEFAVTRSYPIPATRAARFAESASEHFRLVDAIAAGEPRTAAIIMQTHIQKTAKAAGINIQLFD